MPQAKTQTLTRTAVLVGAPNVGKSVLFHALTGRYATVSNYPGTTVDLMQGPVKINDIEWQIYDTPGVIGLPPKTDDERVAQNLIFELEPDVIVQVADAKNLSKAMPLTLALGEFGRPMVLALNMSDERADAGMVIDVKRLSSLLGIPVVETIGITGTGISELKKAFDGARTPRLEPRYDSSLSEVLRRIEENLSSGKAGGARAVATALFGKDDSAWPQAERLAKDGSLDKIRAILRDAHGRFVRMPEALIFEAKQQITREIVAEVQSSAEGDQKTILGRLGNWTLRPVPGFLTAVFSLVLLYQFVGVFGAGTLVDLLESQLFGNVINPLCTRVVETVIPFTLVQEALVGEYGAITVALTYALALIFPIVTTFFLFFGVLEDSGYLPRLAMMLDRVFRTMGLNGRAVVPMVLGLGCGTMATVTTRILSTKKEKIIVSLLLTLSVPCSAQLGAIFGMAAQVSWKVLAVWIGVVSVTTFFVGWAAAKLLPGARTPLLIEIPPLRRPKISNILTKVKMRLVWYAKEVIPLFVLATFILFVLDKFHALKLIERALSPLVVTFLGLPAQSAEVFLMGFLRRDYGAAGFFSMTQDGLMDPRQIAVSMVVISLFMPCFAHLLVTVKERGRRVAAGILIFVLTFAFLIGGAVNGVLRWTAFLA